MKKWVILLMGLISFFALDAQPLEVKLKPVIAPNLPGLQSFAWGSWQGKVLLIGGRVDGLHRRQPFATFDEAGNNIALIVLNPQNGSVFTASTNDLPAALQEQLHSTNMQFHQSGNYLVLTGGYGFSGLAGDHLTFPRITIVDVQGLISAVESGNSIVPFFNTSEDERFAITGGRLERIGTKWHLLGGHRFDGRYNPMNGPSFTQTYTNALIRFDLNPSQGSAAISNFERLIDTAFFHRRDYNLVPQIFPDQSEGITAYSGVFRTDLDLPFLNAITVRDTGIYEESNFLQYLHQYHCAVMPVYIPSENSMHTVFFGGMSQYYPDSTGELVQDNNVPFVTTISDVIRDASGHLSENLLDVKMPGLLGAGAEFFPAEGVSLSGNRVLNVELETGDSLLAGYIFGGIRSDGANIFWTNDGTQSEASNVLFEVWIGKSSIQSIQNKKTGLSLRAYPCPMNDHIYVEVQLVSGSDIEFKLFNSQGKQVAFRRMKNQPAGLVENEFKFKKGLPAGMYVMQVETNQGIERLKILVSE